MESLGIRNRHRVPSRGEATARDEGGLLRYCVDSRLIRWTPHPDPVTVPIGKRSF